MYEPEWAVAGGRLDHLPELPASAFEGREPFAGQRRVERLRFDRPELVQRRRRDQLFHALVDAGVPIRSDLFAPAGLDIGAESPEEIALAIIAEIQSTFALGSTESLHERRAPIHDSRAAVPA